MERQLARKFDDNKFKEICWLSVTFMKFITKMWSMQSFILKTNLYENGEKTGRLLARQLKQIDNQNVVTAMKRMIN